MIKAICIEESNKNIVRVLATADPSIIEENPTNSNYVLIVDYEEPPILDNHMSVNYPMYDKVNNVFKWIQIQYQNTATEEMLQIENLKAENLILQNDLATANENINMLVELQADTLGGAI